MERWSGGAVGRRFSELLLRKVKGIFILFCFPISLNACLPASLALHSLSEAFHAFRCTFLHSGLSLSLSLFFPSILLCSTLCFSTRPSGDIS